MDRPGFEARCLGTSLLLELRQHQIESRDEPALLIREPLVHAAIGLCDRAVETFAPRGPCWRSDRRVRVLRSEVRSARRLLGRDIIRVGVRSLILEGIGQGVGDLGRHVRLLPEAFRACSQPQAKGRRVGLGYVRHVAPPTFS